VPAALSNHTPFQRTLSNTFNADGGTAKIFESKANSVGIIAAEFPAGAKPILTVTSQVKTKNYAVDLSAPGKAPQASLAELDYFLRPTTLQPTDGIVRETSQQITKDANGRCQSACDLRVDRRQHVSQSQDARMRCRRYSVHA
jgi:hypothetical protein